MHLDCVFSVLSDSCCIMLEDIMGEGSTTRRLVDEYTRDPATGKYKVTRCVAQQPWIWIWPSRALEGGHRAPEYQA